MATQSSWVLDFRVLVLIGCSVATINSDVPLRPKEMLSLLEEGRRQYNLVNSRTSMPAFGSCWKNAVTRLQFGCQHLDDRVQSDVALSFANCFLEGAGLPRHDCDPEDAQSSGPSRKEICLKSMSERAFIAYTEFFTHTQSMCFFIMSQVWHEVTENTIDRLSTSAADVARQLEVSEELQEELLQHQRKSVVIQQELLDNGMSLGSMLHESRDSLNLIFTEFRTSTLEQQRLLSMVFHHLSTLQSWIVGEVSWVDSIVFYIPSFAFVYFLTSAQRTANARIPGLLLLLTAGLTERCISYILLNDGAEPTSFQPVDVINERLSWWVWLVRRCAIAINTFLLSVTLYCYRNREEVMHQLLEQIRNQNEELLNHINNGVKSDSFRLNKSRTPDEVDAFGYMPVLTNLSSSFSGCSSYRSLKESPVTTHIKPIARAVPSLNGLNSADRKVDVGIPTAHSAFKPIKENSPVHVLEINGVAKEEEKELAPNSNITSSTPRSKTRRKITGLSESPSSSRYNLRRSRALTTSLV